MLTFLYSAEGKGTYRMGITSFAYIPLSVTSPEEAPGLIEGVAKKIDDAKRDGKLPPGLAEQLDIQLEILRNDTVPDVEVVAVPSHVVAPSKCDDKIDMDIPYLCTKVIPSLERPTQHCFALSNIHSLVDISLVVMRPGYVHAETKAIHSMPEARIPSSSQKLSRTTSTGRSVSCSVEIHIVDNLCLSSADLEVLVQTVKYARSLREVEPWKSSNNRELDPGPDCKTDEQIQGS